MHGHANRRHGEGERWSCHVSDETELTSATFSFELPAQDMENGILWKVICGRSARGKGGR